MNGLIKSDRYLIRIVVRAFTCLEDLFFELVRCFTVIFFLLVVLLALVVVLPEELDTFGEYFALVN